MWKRYIHIALLSIFSVLVIACDDDENLNPSDTPTNNADYSTLVSFFVLNDYTINLYAVEKLYVGYNHFKVEVRDNNTDEVLSISGLNILPTMDMGENMHSAPRRMIAEDKFDVLFIMPSMSDRKWNLGLSFEINGELIEQDFDLDVVNSDFGKVISEEGHHDSGSYVIALKKSDWNVGLNDIEFVLYEQKSLMQFHPVNDATFSMEPDMPSMQHGSNNNVAPTTVDSEGLYAGKVNFTMTGQWRVTVELEIPNNHGHTTFIDKIEMFVQVR